MRLMPAKLVCLVFGHAYLPWHEEVQVRTERKSGYHIRFLFRFQCCRCVRWTPWMRRSRLAAWEAKHSPRWGNYREERRNNKRP